MYLYTNSESPKYMQNVLAIGVLCMCLRVEIAVLEFLKRVSQCFFKISKSFPGSKQNFEFDFFNRQLKAF
jgi:hypothetical protein